MRFCKGCFYIIYSIFSAYAFRGFCPGVMEVQMQEKKPSRTGWLPSVCIVLLCCLIAWLGANWLVPEKTNSLNEYIELPAYAGQPCVPLGDSAAYYDGTILYALRENGMQRWSYLAGANAGFHTGVGGVTTWTGAQVTLLDETSGDTVFSVTMAKKVLSARAGNLYVAVCTGDEDDVTMIILDRNGKQVDFIEKPNLTVLDYGFFNSGNLFWLMTLDSDGTVPTSQLTTYKPGKMETGSIIDSEQVVYKVLFHSTNIRAVGTSYARSYDYTGKENAADRLLVYGWYLQDLYGDGENPLMLFVPMEDTGGVAAIQDVRLVQGSFDRTIRLPYACFDVFAGNSVVYGFTNDYLVLGTINGSASTIYQLPVFAEDVLGITEDNKALVVSGGKVYLVELPA